MPAREFEKRWGNNEFAPPEPRDDALFVAVGQARMITAEMIKPGAVVIEKRHPRLVERLADAGETSSIDAVLAEDGHGR